MSQDWKHVLHQWWREQRPDLQEAVIFLIQFPGCKAVEIDPHFWETRSWFEASKCDGFTYNGILGRVVRLPFEDLETFFQRAQRRAAELQEQVCQC